MKRYRDYLFSINEGDNEGEIFAVEIVSVNDDVFDLQEACDIAQEYFPNNWKIIGEKDPEAVEAMGIDTY